VGMVRPMVARDSVLARLRLQFLHPLPNRLVLGVLRESRFASEREPVSGSSCSRRKASANSSSLAAFRSSPVISPYRFTFIASPCERTNSADRWPLRSRSTCCSARRGVLFLQAAPGDCPSLGQCVRRPRRAGPMHRLFLPPARTAPERTGPRDEAANPADPAAA